MPTVTATSYPYTPFPTVPTPEVGGGNPLDKAFQHFETSPAMFGGLQATALQKFGETLGQSANTLANTAIDIQNYHNKVVVDQQITSYEDKINAVLYGDPTNAQDAGYMGLQGQAALDARPAARAQLEQLRKDHQSVLQNTPQRLAFDNQSRGYLNRALGYIGQHYEAEYNRNAQQTMEGRAGVALTNVGIASNNNDFEAFKSAWGTGRAALIDSFNIPGRQLAPELQEAKLREYDEKAVFDWTTKLATRDPVAADAFADANRDYMPTRYDDAKRAVKAEATKAQDNWIQNGGPRPTSVPSMVPRQPNLPGGTFFNRIVNAGERSAQAAVSPKGNVGVSQISPDTAKEIASERGIPYDEDRLRTDERYNRQLGEAYANKMLQRYGGNEMLAAAAYNAGPGTVDQWLKDIGDPRSGKVSPEEWARKIPVAETRDYVMRVAPPGATRLGGTGTPATSILGGPPNRTRVPPDPGYGTPGSFPSGPGGAGTAPPPGGYPPPRAAGVDPASRGLPTTDAAAPIEVWGDSLGMGLNSRLQTPGRSTGGARPAAILADIKKEPEDRWQGKRVVLASGSNGNDMDTVEETAQYLKDHGASVVLVGYGPRFPQKNARLADISNRLGLRVVPAEGVDPAEGVHPSSEGYDSMVRTIRTQPRGLQSGQAPTLTPPGPTTPGPGPVEPGPNEPRRRRRS